MSTNRRFNVQTCTLWTAVLLSLAAGCTSDREDLGVKNPLASPGLSAAKLAALDNGGNGLCTAGEAEMRFATPNQFFGFGLDLPAGASLRLQTSGDPVDTILYLFQPAASGPSFDTTPFASDDDSAGAGNARIAGATVPRSGRYLALVGTASGNGKGRVVLSVAVDGSAGCTASHPDDADAPDVPDTMEVPDTPEVSDTTGVPDTMEVPDTTEVPDTAEVPDVSPGCDPVLTPNPVNFGITAVGVPKTVIVMLRNRGTQPCTFVQAAITDCSGAPVACPDPFQGAASSTFTLGELPAAAQDAIAPGQGVAMSVRYLPPSTGAATAAQLSVKVSGADATPIVLTVPLGGEVGSPRIAVLPTDIDFGLTVIGCHSRRTKVCVYSTSDTTLTVFEAALQDCAPEFVLIDVGSLPVAVSQGNPWCFTTDYVPQTEGKQACSLRILSSDSAAPAVIVPLEGSGTYMAGMTDEFVQVKAPKLDVLFAIDDSGSMCDKQERLAQAFDQFLDQVGPEDVDIHVGVVSINVVDERVAGRLNRGNPQAPVRFMTWDATDPEALFTQLVSLGCTGCPPWLTCTTGQITDVQESGLEAVMRALSAPLDADTGVACAATTDCLSNPTVCPDPTSCVHACLDTGTCAGPNAGFLRPEAQLEVVVLSDEEDQSPSSAVFYVSFLADVKGVANPGMMHFNAIVAPEDGCGGSGSGSEGEGKRYAQVVLQTGGYLGSVCDPDYGALFDQLAQTGLELKTQFFLSRLADPTTLEVQVDGVVCAAGWNYDEASNSIIFDPQGPCTPGPGETTRVNYTELCLAS